MPTNLYGYNDNYDLENSHVLAMIRKFHEAKINKTDVNLWEQVSLKESFYSQMT
jgi:GDP-L-fucose synthase